MILIEEENIFLSTLNCDKQCINNVNDFLVYESNYADVLPLERCKELPVDILIDTARLAEASGHEPWIWFRNGYINEEFLPISISLHPELIFERDLNITNNDLYSLYEFIINNCNGLIACAKGKLSLKEFVKKYWNKGEILIESKFPLNKILQPDETGLSCKIYIDTGKTYLRGGHWKRVKFEYPINSPYYGWPHITLPDIQLGKDVKIKIPKNVLKPVLNFVRNHYNDIDSTLDGNISFDDLKKRILQNDEIIEVGQMLYGWQRIRNQYWKYNYVNETGDFISEEWFDKGSDFKQVKGGIAYAVIEKDGIQYFLLSNGELKDFPQFA